MALQIRGLNPRTKKWEPYPLLTRLARWGCSLLIHALESVVSGAPLSWSSAPPRAWVLPVRAECALAAGVLHDG